MAKTFDVIIIGGGPAGLAAAIYASRYGMKTALIERISTGGQIFITAEVENYPGIEKTSGPLLARTMEKQALHFGTEIIIDEVESISLKENSMKSIKGASGEIYEAQSVIIATGAKYRNLGAPGEDKFRGRGVSNCATCDAMFYKNKEVAVIGGGDTAVEEADFLAKFAAKVSVIHRRSELRAVKAIQEKALKNPKITFIFDTVVEEIAGLNGVEKLLLKNVKTNAKSEIKADGVFVLVGYDPATVYLKGFVDLDPQGYVIASRDMETNVPGVFACGDCIVKKLRQVVTAAGDGAVAAYGAYHYIEKLRGGEYA